MKLWNLSRFEDLSTAVLSSVDQGATASVPMPKRRWKDRNATMSLSLGSVVMVAAIACTALYVNVSGSDGSLLVKTVDVSRNVADDRPPLHLLFGGKHEQKWDEDKETHMLERALVALGAPPNDVENRTNTIIAALTENLPSSRETAIDLDTMGLRLK